MMSSAVPGPIYALEVPPREILTTNQLEFPAAFRITMAALDPTQEPVADEEGNVPTVCRSTLRLVKRSLSPHEGDDEEVDGEYFQDVIGGSDDEDEDDEANGGPSDPAKAKKQKQAAAIQKLLAAATEEGSGDEEMEDAEAKPKSKKDKSKSNKAQQPKGKGKGKAVVEEEDEDDEDDEEEEGELEDYVLCTLDTDRHYQQPLDITINQGQKVYFIVSGTHPVYLTGNYIMDDREHGDEEEEEDDDDEEDGDYGVEDLDFVVSDEESDELDDIDNPRITELESDAEEIPTLIPTAKKGKLKRRMEEQEASLDDIIAKANASAAKDAKASKKQEKQEKQQQKKLKNNKGEAVAAEVKPEAQEDGKKDGKKNSKKDKKDAKKTVQFAKNLEQGPTGSVEKAKQAATKASITKVQGVTIDDRTVGKGRTAKNGDTVGVRYIGKLQNGKQFDANKKGKPFSFRVGKGQVIKGWDIGIAGMAIGGERRLTIPSNLAYASKSLPGIPANSTLIFDIKLLEIK